MSGSDYMKPMTDTDTDYRYKNGGISQMRLKVTIHQGNLFLPQNVTTAMNADLHSAILEVLKKHARKP